MKTASSGLDAHLRGEVTTLATCWQVRRRDGAVQGFTDHVADLAIDIGDGRGLVTYAAATGYARSAIQTSARLSVDNLEVVGFFDSDGISEEDLRRGAYDFAEVKVFLVNYEDPGQGTLKLRRGRLGEVRKEDERYVAELRGLLQAYAQSIIEVYTPDCRADLGDSRCKVDLAPLTVAATVSEVTDRRTFRTESAGLDLSPGFYDGGLVTWTSGDNAGVAMEVETFEAGTKEVTLLLAMPRDIQPGDSFTAAPGCDKRLSTCRDRFDNVVNFRGEPHVPGLDQVLRTPDAGA